MKRIAFLLAMFSLATIKTFAQAADADKIIGTWLTEDKDLKIEIFKSGNAYSGKLLWAKDMFLPDGRTPKEDDKNPDEKLRSRSRQNIVNITGLTYSDGEYSDGRLYNPQNGSTYRLKAEVKGPDKLEMRGYLGISLLGRTVKWTRVR